MSYEAVPFNLYGPNDDGQQRRYTVTSSATFTKGAVLKMTSPVTAALADGSAQPCAGIISHDKTTDHSTTVSCWTQGVFRMYCSGAITVGAPVQVEATSSYPNFVSQVAGLVGGVASGAAVIGHALETGAQGDVIQIRVNL